MGRNKDERDQGRLRRFSCGLYTVLVLPSPGSKQDLVMDYYLMGGT